jgi:hypothetical protein
MDNKVKKTNNTSFAKLIADNRFLMVLSIAIAFALWLWVAIENVVFTAKENLTLENNDEQIEGLIKELIANHTIG